VALPLAALLLILAVLAGVGYGPGLSSLLRRRRAGRRESIPEYDPGRERRAEVKARELMRSVIGERLHRMYVELGFINVAEPSGRGDYSYLLYPHRPIVAYDARSGELLNEYCVGFPDHSADAPRTRLPDADDVLAKWMALSGDERKLIGGANMNMPGRQIDPRQVERDLRRLTDWEAMR
jgi:hypothetical protein